VKTKTRCMMLVAAIVGGYQRQPATVVSLDEADAAAAFARGYARAVTVDEESLPDAPVPDLKPGELRLATAAVPLTSDTTKKPKA
jgi:hypothetical protein